MRRRIGAMFVDIPDDRMSLPEAYWLWGVVGNLFISTGMGSAWGTFPPPLPMIAWLAYNVWAHYKIWSAAKVYAGLSLWKVLAQTAVVLSCVLMILGTIGLLGVLLERINNLDPENGRVLYQLLLARITP
jgi:hypothetical protein